jgi:hypothetical protein
MTDVFALNGTMIADYYDAHRRMGGTRADGDFIVKLVKIFDYTGDYVMAGFDLVAALRATDPQNPGLSLRIEAECQNLFATAGSAPTNIGSLKDLGQSL